jgi:hypothetical protein
MVIYKRKFGIDRQQTGFGPCKGDGDDQPHQRSEAFFEPPEST